MCIPSVICTWSAADKLIVCLNMCAFKFVLSQIGWKHHTQACTWMEYPCFAHIVRGRAVPTTCKIKFARAQYTMELASGFTRTCLLHSHGLRTCPPILFMNNFHSVNLSCTFELDVAKLRCRYQLLSCGGSFLTIKLIIRISWWQRALRHGIMAWMHGWQYVSWCQTMGT